MTAKSAARARSKNTLIEISVVILAAPSPVWTYLK